MRERTWTRGDGRTIPIAEMKTGHLVNSIMMLERNADRARQPPEALYNPQYEWLVDELATRVGEGLSSEDLFTGCKLVSLSGFLEHLVKNHGAEKVAVALDKAIDKVEGA